jgi:hypothetical protein
MEMDKIRHDYEILGRNNWENGLVPSVNGFLPAGFGNENNEKVVVTKGMPAGVFHKSAVISLIIL